MRVLEKSKLRSHVRAMMGLIYLEHYYTPQSLRAHTTPALLLGRTVAGRKKTHWEAEAGPEFRNPGVQDLMIYLRRTQAAHDELKLPTIAYSFWMS